jgi:hypothetical protein
VTRFIAAALVSVSFALGAQARTASYAWLESRAPLESVRERFAPPEGFVRTPVRTGSYAEWVRGLPMLPRQSPVVSYRGDVLVEGTDSGLAGVVDLDIGREDLQQCADAILRLRAEYLWQSGARRRIAFRFTSGDVSSWSKWSRGYRPVIRGTRARFVRKTRRDASRASFRAYLTNLFRFAGSHSLAREGRRVGAGSVRPGDFISLGGSPGHAILIVDVVEDASGDRRVLLGQSYMPAQSFHLLNREDGSPWFRVETGGAVRIRTWPAPFPWSRLRRF